MSCITSQNGRPRSKLRGIISALGLVPFLLFGQAATVSANPTGGAVVAGSATIGSAGKTLNINQTTQSAIINWQQFSIASGETTKFLVPNSSSATLNRVFGGNPSLIYGSLQSNGILYLVNPSGIVVGPSGRIDTAGFLASTLDVSNQQFLKGGDLDFTGSSDASINNEGTIHASSGDVYLIANQVANSGTLSAPQGNVGLASGSDVLFQQAGNQHLFVQATPAGTTRAMGVTNTGTIHAAAAELKAAGGNAYALAINNSGEIAATGYKKINGQVYLVSNGGNITNSGKISSRNVNGSGGAIVLNGSGTASAGAVTNSGLLDASAIAAQGQGGSITLKNSNGRTVDSGQILAKGGQGGIGGDAEISGEQLGFTGSVDLTAPGGKTGNLLLDPGTLDVITGGTGTVVGTQNDSTSTTIDPTTVEAALGTANLTLNANTNITVSNAITWTSTNTLTLSTNTAGSTIDLNAPISGVNGGLTIATAAATDVITPTSSIEVTSFILQSGSWQQVNATLPAFTANNDFELRTGSTFLRASGGTGTTGSPYLITDIYGLQGLASASLLVASADLANNIDATGTAAWNNGAGFVPIGTYDGSSEDAASYRGTFNGQGYYINGLTVNLPDSSSGVGLFGDTGIATLENLSLTNVSITGFDYVGGLVGVNNATVTTVSVGGSVNGTNYVGGLEGNSAGAISNSYSYASVIGSSGGSSIGGLGGLNQGGTITDCYSSGSVTGGSSSVGGLVGSNTGTVTNSFWDTTTSNITSPTGGVGSGTNSGVLPATTTQLESQTFIQQNSSPPWDFTTIWTTASGTELPHLQDLVNAPPPGTDTLGGTDYVDSGVNGASDATIDLLFDGSLLGTTTTSNTGAFSFNVSAADLTGGILLTDPAHQGNTFYQANSPASTITGIDLWGNTLRVMADTASNGALATTAGNFASNGVNFSVSSANLTTNAGINISILSKYTLDGNVIANGTLSTGSGSVLSGNTSVTLTGTSVAMAGTFNLGSSLAVVSTLGAIDLNGVGTLAVAATAQAVTLTATGPAIVNSSYLSLSGGNFTASGTGNSTVSDGVDILNSSITAGGGSISLTGQATFANGEGGNVAGIGVYVDNSLLQNASSGSEITSGDITIMGNGSVGAGIATVNNLVGAYITHSVLSVVNGAISVTGDVNSATAQAFLNEDGSASPFTGRSIGVAVDDGSVVSSSGTGSVTLTGDTTGSTAEISNLGVDLSGLDPNAGTIVTSIISAAGGLGVNVTGTAGDINNSSANGQTPSTTGIVLEFGTHILASDSAPITMNGTGGTDLNTLSAGLSNETSEGIAVEASPSDVSSGSPNVSISSASGTISLTGTGGSSIGTVNGIQVHSNTGALVSITSSAGNIALTGTATNTADQTTGNSNDNGGDAGVNIGVDNASGSASSVTASAGSIYIKGVVSGGTINSKEAGVVISRGSTVTATGTGGAVGATAQGDVTIVGTTTGTTAQSLNGGVFIEGNGTRISASGIVADAHGGTGLTITGTSDAIDGSTGASIDASNGNGGVNLEPMTAGIGLLNGAELESLGAAPVTLNGTGGANNNTLDSGSSPAYVNAVTGATSGSYGVAIFSPVAEQTTTISSGGNLSVTGAAGSSPTTGVGVMIGGPSNVGSVSITSAQAITLNGTGGSGNVTGSPVPNAGVAIFDPGNDSGTVSLAANGGDLSIAGTSGGGSDSVGVDGLYYFNSVDDSSSNDPSLRTSAALQIVSDSGLVNGSGFAGEIFALSTSVTAPVGTDSVITVGASSGPLSLNGGNFTVSGYPNGPITLAASTVGNLSITNDGGTTIAGPIVSTGQVDIADTGGNITLAPGGSISDSGSGNNVILAAGTGLANSHYIVNNSSNPNPIQVSGGNFYLYSSDPTHDSFGNVTVSPMNVAYSATYETSGQPAANQELFYVASSGDTGPNAPGAPPTNPSTPPSTGTGGADGGGSNIVPPAITPQSNQPVAPPGTDTGTMGNAPPPPPFSFTGNDIGAETGQQGGGDLASSSGNGGQVGSGDSVQLGGGQVNNMGNAQASGALNQALGPAVYHSLVDALAMIGDWDAPAESGTDTGATGGDQETILSGGDVVEIGDNHVKQIPLSQAPKQLQNAMSGDVRKGMDAGTGH